MNFKFWKKTTTPKISEAEEIAQELYNNIIKDLPQIIEEDIREKLGDEIKIIVRRNKIKGILKEETNDN